MNILGHLNRRLTSESFDARAGQLIAWAASILILALGFYKLTTLVLTEAQLFFGVLLVLAVSLLGVIVGLLLPIAQEHQMKTR